MITVRHGGKLGDIIYSLPLIKELKEKYNDDILLLLGNDKLLFNIWGYDSNWQLKLNWIKDILIEQDYISSVKLYDNEIIDFDLDKFRNTVLQFRSKSILEHHFLAFNLNFNKYKHERKWLKSYDNKNEYDFVVGRSFQYRDTEDYYNILKDTNSIFIGMEKEYNDFINNFNIDIKFKKVETSLELLKVIDSGKKYIGNQSLPLSIAIGLGKHVIVEEYKPQPNCRCGNYKKM